MMTISKVIAAPLTAAFALLVCVGGPTAHAQAITSKSTCIGHGANWAEPVGDRDGHRLQVSEATCLVEGGPLDGAVVTQHTIWEIDKGTGTMLSSHGVNRKPGAMTAYANISGTLSFQMTDGRVTGWTASGKGRNMMATGSASSVAGKTYNWTARPTGPRTYVVELVYE